jgi:transcriptional regulator NrdR family protein
MARALAPSTTEAATRALKMPCPHCGESWESIVVDSRGGVRLPRTRGTLGVYRRRECVHCRERFTTYEVLALHN